MLSEREAIGKLKMLFPARTAQKIITWGDLYLLLAPSADPVEGEWDPFFSVDKNTGEVSDYSIYKDGQAKEISSLFEKAPQIGRR